MYLVVAEPPPPPPPDVFCVIVNVAVFCVSSKFVSPATLTLTVYVPLAVGKVSVYVEASDVLTLYSTFTVPSVTSGATVYVAAVTLPSFCDKLLIAISGTAFAISNGIVNAFVVSSDQE